jgi:hypothetical protein
MLVHDREVAPILRNWDGPAPNSRFGPYNGTDPSAHPRECHRCVFISWESGTNWVLTRPVTPSTWAGAQMNRSEFDQSPIEFKAGLMLAVPVGYGPGVIGPGYPTPVPGADPVLLT